MSTKGMQVGFMGFINETEDDPNNSFDDCWMYGTVLLYLPSAGADDYIP